MWGFFSLKTIIHITFRSAWRECLLFFSFFKCIYLISRTLRKAFRSCQGLQEQAVACLLPVALTSLIFNGRQKVFTAQPSSKKCLLYVIACLKSNNKTSKHIVFSLKLAKSLKKSCLKGVKRTKMTERFKAQQVGKVSRDTHSKTMPAI